MGKLIFRCAFALLTPLSSVRAQNDNSQSSTPPTRSNSDYALINSHIVTVKGTVLKHSRILAGPHAGQEIPVPTCQIHFQLAPNEQAVEARGVSTTRFNDNECEIDMEVGQPPDSVIEAAKKQAAQIGNAVEPDASPGTSSGYSQGWFTDPVGIWVNSEQVNISWNWNGNPTGCASLYSSSRGVPASFPGWYNTSWYLSQIYNCGYVGSYWIAYAGAQDIAQWENDVFPACGGVSVYADYNPLTAFGGNLGNLLGNFQWALYGPACIYLLTPNFQLIRTYN